jgi:hypothetical protein
MATNGFPDQSAAECDDADDETLAVPVAFVAQRSNIDDEAAGMIAAEEPDHDDGDGPDASPVSEEGRLTKKIKAFNRFIDETQRGLDPSAALVWLTLFRQAWNGVAEVPQSTIAKKLGVGTKTVQRGIEKLVALKLLTITRHGGNGRGCHKYQLGLRALDSRPKKPRLKKPRPK